MHRNKQQQNLNKINHNIIRKEKECKHAPTHTTLKMQHNRNTVVIFNNPKLPYL
jgi:hypothetical protein